MKLNEEKQYNECIECGDREFTASAPISKFICNACAQIYADAENEHYTEELDSEELFLDEP